MTREGVTWNDSPNCYQVSLNCIGKYYEPARLAHESSRKSLIRDHYYFAIRMQVRKETGKGNFFLMKLMISGYRASKSL